MTSQRLNLSRKLKELRDSFVEECRAGAPGLRAACTYSSSFHEALRRAFAGDSPEHKEWALLAVGGFGRGELSFASDLDLLFLYKKRLPGFLEELVRELVYGLWDSGFEVGHQTASISISKRLASDDFTVLTNYLEARFIAGDKDLFDNWRKSFVEGFGSNSRRRFLQNLIEYRESRLQQYGESPYLLEPHVKEGGGGMRDLHVIRWAGIVYLADPSLEALTAKGWITETEKLWLDQAHDFLWRVRLQLHQLTGRRQDQLLFPEQEQIAGKLGCMAGQQGTAVEVFMRLYYRYTSRIRRTTSFFLERIGESRKRFPGFTLRKRVLPGPFLLESKHLHFMEPEWVGKDPRVLMRFFWQAARSGANFHHQAGRIIRENLKQFTQECARDHEVIKQFFEILLDPEQSFRVLKTMLETGFLQTFIPEFSAVRYRVQNDVYHLYTVDEHLLRTVREMHKIGEPGKDPEILFPRNIFVQPEHRRVLFLAALLHDIGKAHGKNHSIHGAAMARDIAARLGLSADDAGLLCFLIEHHLILAETAQKRDLMDEKPISQCAVQIKDSESLLLLYLLTAADSRATGTGAWSAWKASLLRELVFKIDRMLLRGDVAPQDLEARSADVHRRVIESVSDSEERERVSEWLQKLPFRYLLSREPGVILQHYGMDKSLSTKTVSLAAEPAEGDMWRITVVTRDRPGLFALITGVLWARGLNILAADIFTREPGVALDILIVERIPDPLHPGELWEKVENDLKQCLADPQYMRQLLADRRKPSFLQNKCGPKKDDRVLVDEEASDFYTIVEVYTWDRPGILHAMTSTLYQLGVSIQLAKISTPGAQVADVFYVTDMGGNKLMDYDLHEKIRNNLLSSLETVC